MIIDMDAANEVDDQYALALALLSPERFEIEGFVGAHFGDSRGPEGIEQSVQEIKTVLEKAGMAARTGTAYAAKFPVKRGSHPFRYRAVPEPSEGVDFIEGRGMSNEG